MANLPPTHSPLFLGVDGGGTKCRAVLVDSNNTVLGVGEGGPANPYHGVERTYESIMNATDIALRNAGLTPKHKANIVAGLGLAGVHLPSLFQIVNLHRITSVYPTNIFATALVASIFCLNTAC